MEEVTDDMFSDAGACCFCERVTDVLVLTHKLLLFNFLQV